MIKKTWVIFLNLWMIRLYTLPFTLVTDCEFLPLEVRRKEVKEK